MGLTRASFKLSGKVPSLIAQLKMSHSKGAIIVATFLKT